MIMAQSVLTLAVVGIVAVIIVAAGLVYYVPTGIVQASELKKFSSYQEMADYLNTSLSVGGAYGGFYGGFGITSRDVLTTAVPVAAPTAAPVAEGGAGAKSEDYSTTNIQVAGVDEPDIVKNDGKYIYTISGNKVVIVDAYPVDGAEIISEIEAARPGGYVTEIFINNDRLIVFGQSQEEYIGILDKPTGIGAPGVAAPSSAVSAPSTEPSSTASITIPEIYPYFYSPKMFVKVYDVTDRSSPVLIRNLTVDGNYFDARMIGDHVYVIVNSPVNYYYGAEAPILVPKVYSSARPITPDFPEIFYFDNPDYSYTFTTIMSFNTQGTEEPNSQVYMMGYATNMYVSLNNIYITYQKHLNYLDFFDRIIDRAILPSVPVYVASEIQTIRTEKLAKPAQIQKITEVYAEHFNTLSEEERQQLQDSVEEKMVVVQEEIAKEIERTVIHRIFIDQGNIEYKKQGSVPGNVLNQFSMDEHEGFFRIATTTTNWGIFGRGIAREPAQKNHVYVLNMDMETVGKLEDLAPGESIFSARFMGDRAYIVTFKKVDPLFVIDLSDPNNPQVLGRLKIPGFSNYLHPYDENYIIGVGKEAAEAESNFAWYRGIKLALFDVSDPQNPIEISKHVIGHRGTDSYALYDHKAFLFSRDRNLLVIPILLAEINPEQYEGEIPDFAYGEYVWQGAYVFSLDTENGFVLKGRVTHVDDENEFKEGGYYYYGGGDSVKRSLYIGDVLYTLSDSLIKMNSLGDLEELNKVSLPFEEQIYPVPLEVAVR